MTRALVIGRRRKGRPIKQVVQETRQRLEDAGWSVDSTVVKGKGALRKHAAAAAADGVDVVVAVGGDGVVLQVVQGVGGTATTLGIVPMGTGNLLATNLGIDRKPDRAITILLDGQRRQIDLGHAVIGKDEWLFSVACGIGFDAEVMDATSKAGKRRWGRLAYVASAITKSGDVRDVQHEITVDGKLTTMGAMQVFIANFGRTGLTIKPRLPVVPDDGALDVIVLRAPGRLRAVATAWQAIRQPHEGRSSDGRVLRSRGKEVTIETHTKRLVEIDGSVVGTTPVRISVRPAALTVLAPPPAPSPPTPEPPTPTPEPPTP